MRYFLICLSVLLSVLIFTPDALAQNYSFYKKITCPEAGVKLKPLDVKGLDALRPMFRDNPNDFTTQCHYEDGAFVSAYWSEAVGAKKQICNTPWYKNMTVGRAPYAPEGDNQPYRVGLGVELQKKNNHDEGVDVIGVMDGSGAQQAGLVRGDRIVSVNKTPVKGLSLPQVVDLTRGRMNEEIKLGVVSLGSKRKRIKKVKIGQYAPPQAKFSVASPSHFVHVAGGFTNNPKTFDQDYAFWREKAIELAQRIESLAVQCKGYEVSEKGPVAD